MDDDGLGLVHGDATENQVQVTPKSFTGRTSDTIDYDGSALPNFMPTILDSDGLNEVIKAIDDQLGVVAGNITDGDATKVSKSLFDANTILKANVDDTPLALTVPEQTLIGRKTGGDIDALAPADVLLALGISASIDELNYVDGVTSAIQTQIDGNDTDITNLQAKFPVVTADIQNLAVTNAKLAANAVSNAKLDSSLQTDITQIDTNKNNITTLTDLTAIATQTIFGRRTGDGTAIGLTATQTLTLLGITVSAANINQLTGINDNVQVQIDNISDTFGNIDAFDEVTINGMTAPTSVDLTHIIAEGVAFINNKRVSTSDTEHTYTASQDIYVDIDDAGTFTFIEVANGADAPALTTDSIRIMKVVTDVNNITTVTDLRPLDLRIDKLLGRKMDVPSGVTATLQAGGSLVDGTELFYVVTATDGSGETIQSTEVSETPTGANLTIKIDWTAVTKAKFYRVYKRESGIYKLYKEVTVPTITLTDDGSAIFVASGSPPLFTNAYRAKLEDIGDVTLEIGSTDITSGTVGRILFEGTGNFLQESANLTWDDATSVLAVTGQLIFDSSVQTDVLKDSNSGALIQFNKYANNDVVITSDNGAYAEGALYIGDVIDLFGGVGVDVSFFANGDSIFNGRATYTEVRYGGTVANTAKLEFQDNSAGDRTSTSGTASPAAFLVTNNSTIKSGVQRSIIVGGQGITGKTNDVVYVPALGFYESGTIEGLLSNATLTADRAWDLPDQSGTIALLSDITGGDGIYDGSGSLSGATVVTMATNNLQFDSTGGKVLLSDGNGIVVGHTAQIDFGEVTSEAQILGTTETDASLAIGLWSATNALAPIVKFMKSGSAAIGDNFTAVEDNEELGKIQAYGADGTDLDTLVAEIAFNVDDASIATGQIGGEMLLKTAKSDGTLTTAMTINNTQFVGIGITPTVQLHIEGSAAQAMIIRSTTNNLNATIHIVNNRPFGNNEHLQLINYGTTTAGTTFGISNNQLAVIQKGFAGNLAIGTRGGIMVFGTVDLEAMRIDTNQHVGIGVDPVTNLHILEANTDTVPTVEIEQTGSGDAALQFSIVGDAYAMGIDNTDDKFKISYAGAAGTAVLGTNDRFTINADGLVEIGLLSGLTAQVVIKQGVLSGAMPVLLLDQADISEEMMEFNTTIGVGNAIEAVGAKSLTVTHFIKVTLPGSLTRYLQVGTIA